jgi:hypothetical protein
VTVLEFAARSLDPPAPREPGTASPVHARSV